MASFVGELATRPQVTNLPHRGLTYFATLTNTSLPCPVVGALAP